MTRTEQIELEALKLPRKARSRILSKLVQSLESDEDPKAAVLWEREIVRRVALDEKGRLGAISAEASLVGLRKRAKH